MYGWSEYCEAGGLLSFGANQRATYFRLATYADRILRGEDPANLPVEQPTKFELVVNRKTANALKIEIPASILLRAERVIESAIIEPMSAFEGRTRAIKNLRAVH